MRAWKCTFTNQKRGRIVVVKDATPDDPQDFTFTTGGGLTPASFQLDDDANPTLSNSQTITNVAVGSGYSVSETVPAGWDLTSATCDDGSPVSNINVGPDETVTCTFNNRKRGQIVVVKDAQPNDPQDFAFTAGGGLSPGELLARRRRQRHAVQHPDLQQRRSRLLLLPQRDASRAAGTRHRPPAATAARCRASTSGPGETVTCTFANAKRGQIVVVKDATPDDAQDFSFTAGGGLSPASFSLDDDANPTLSNTQTFSSVVPGAGYSITETVPSGWDQTSRHLQRRQPARQHRRGRGRDRHVHVRQPQARADRGRQERRAR